RRPARRPSRRVAGLGRGFFARSGMDRELDEELGAYLEELARRKQAGGLSAADARRAARAETGDLRQVKAAVRESWLVSSWDAALAGVRQAWRGLAATPGLSALAVLTFALGVGSAGPRLRLLPTPPPSP